MEPVGREEGGWRIIERGVTVTVGRGGSWGTWGTWGRGRAEEERGETRRGRLFIFFIILKEVSIVPKRGVRNSRKYIVERRCCFCSILFYFLSSFHILIVCNSPSLSCL